MAKRIENPTTKVSDGKTVRRHPAYGQIVISQMHGERVLYGSEHTHGVTMALSVFRSELHRSLSHDRPSADRLPIVRVVMSQSQWAQMVSSMGSGEGTQCTVEYADGQSMPALPMEDSGQTYKDEADAKLRKVLDELDRLRADVEDATSGIPKGKRATLLGRINAASQVIGSDLGFVAQSFAEHVERTKDRGKMELMAWADAMFRRRGIAVTRGETPIGIEGSSEPPVVEP